MFNFTFWQRLPKLVDLGLGKVWIVVQGQIFELGQFAQGGKVRDTVSDKFKMIQVFQAHQGREISDLID